MVIDSMNWDVYQLCHQGLDILQWIESLRRFDLDTKGMMRCSVNRFLHSTWMDVQASSIMKIHSIKDHPQNHFLSPIHDLVRQNWIKFTLGGFIGYFDHVCKSMLLVH